MQLASCGACRVLNPARLRLARTFHGVKIPRGSNNESVSEVDEWWGAGGGWGWGGGE